MAENNEFEGRRRRRDDDDEFEERPRRPRRRDDDETPNQLAPKSIAVPLILTLALVAFVLTVFGGVAIALLLPAVTKVRSAANRAKETGHLKQIGLAAHNLHDTNDHLPMNTYDAAGKPLLSWRVHLLPYLEHEDLYRQFKLDEPWDSPNNRRLLDQMPSVYGRAASTPENRGSKTFVRAFSSPGAVMERITPEKLGRPGGRLRPAFGLDEITDGLHNTIFCVEAGVAVEWTKPDDLTWDVGQPLPPLGGDRGTDEFLAGLMDGSVRSVKKTIMPEQLKALITIAGREPANLTNP